MICLLVFKVTATTEIYTYCHTHALHDAVPSTSPWMSTMTASTLPLPSRYFCNSPSTAADGSSSGSMKMRPITCTTSRSAVHTSELQTLMRISFAVFSLYILTIEIAREHITLTIIHHTEPKHLQRQLYTL